MRFALGGLLLGLFVAAVAVVQMGGERRFRKMPLRVYVIVLLALLVLGYLTAVSLGGNPEAGTAHRVTDAERWRQLDRMVTEGFWPSLAGAAFVDAWLRVRSRGLPR
jgi:hypothetical protein